MCELLCCIFFCKQKTAYEVRISDWSSDVCSSDLRPSLSIPSLARSGSGEGSLAVECNDGVESVVEAVAAVQEVLEQFDRRHLALPQQKAEFGCASRPQIGHRVKPPEIGRAHV